MEGMVMLGKVFENKSVIVTGHTGFKGFWLAKWLNILGAEVTGISLDPNLDTQKRRGPQVECREEYLDIRDLSRVQTVFNDVQPDYVFHLAAQSLVLRSYEDPINNWTTNVIGTANILQACTEQNKLKGVLCATTDKCYENKGWLWGYREVDRLGGDDPYSASKASCELLINSYRKSFPNDLGKKVISVRGGNVIGGNDWSAYRLIPDIMKDHFYTKRRTKIRNPNSTRPWQHVLDCLSGYLAIAEVQMNGGNLSEPVFNVGPALSTTFSVREIVEVIMRSAELDLDIEFLINDGEQVREANMLHLDCTRLRNSLDWSPKLTMQDAILQTVEWYKKWAFSEDDVSEIQIKRYMEC